ncbi:uncharacterized protein LOC122860082 [Aphidius gifuensis]|uniref:uncharacterized protein LOC122860082 n=1 Tax=Aphidius gifuensis TaxID=684658 RepID=UPI001CDD871F|nr:uncharacterized protein LOC122860082 [Aphidius gifuensis]
MKNNYTYIETINKNLTLITSNKKSLQKVVEETVEEHGLPISSACRTKALNLFSTAAKFINDSQKYNFYSGENAKDVTEIAELIQISNENSIKEISNFKNKVEEIRSVNQCSRLLNDYSSLQGSQGEKSQFDESIFD